MAPLADTQLFQPMKLGDLHLQHRVIMAPLTRVRSPEHIPDCNVVEYYSQRATAGGMLISEATHISVMGGNFYGAPGIFTPEHIRAWRAVTSAVHAKSGYIFCQLWHIGRAAVPANLGGRRPFGPSENAIPNGKAYFTPVGVQPTVVAQAMTRSDIRDTVADYVHAARCAIEAGFDGVEIHDANGYLLDQFLCDNINVRMDEYGGSPERRARFSCEVVDAVAHAIGREKVGIRFSPFGFYQGTFTSNIMRDYGHVVREMDKRGLAYIHLIGPEMDLTQPQERKREQLKQVALAQGVDEGRFKEVFSLKLFREMIKNTPFIANESAGNSGNPGTIRLLEDGTVDALVYGRLFISNPDLVERLRNGWLLQKWDAKTFYTPGKQGYTDYPAYQEAKL